MTTDYSVLIEGHKSFIIKVLKKDKLRIPLLILSKQIREVKKDFLLHKAEADDEKEFEYLVKVTDSIDRNPTYRFLNKTLHDLNDIVFEKKYRNHKGQIKKTMKRVGYKYLSIVCIIKNEARYIKEWIAYYKLMEVDHIYLYNNGSTDKIQDVLADEIASGYVTLIEFKGANAQLPVYRMTSKFLRRQCRWVAYIDADEFVLPKEGTLKEYLMQKEMHPAIGINWIVYGTGGHKTRPDGLVSENYWYTFEDANNLLNLRIKSIVDPSKVYDISSPHFCVLKNGTYAVDEDDEEITTKWMYVSGSGPAFTGQNKTERIRINHYWTKSEQDLAEKCNRGYAAGSFSPDYENIMKRLDYPQRMDRSIECYVPRIKDILGMK